MSSTNGGAASVGGKGVIELKNPREIELMRSAGKIAARALSAVGSAVKPGVSTGELDEVARKEIQAANAAAAFLNYNGFPSTICASVNDEVVHGIPSRKRILKEGDIISIDLGVVLNGYYADCAETFAVGKISGQAQKLLDVTRRALERSISLMRPGLRIGDIGAEIEGYVLENGMSVVKEFVGHGIGRKLHEEPAVPNYGTRGLGAKLEEGLVLAVEPMVNTGKSAVSVSSDGWTVTTADGSLSAHFEHTVAVVKNGAVVLTLEGR